ncbi:tetratricopeptide repeat protein [Brevundimonas naejangsanensis]
MNGEVKTLFDGNDLRLISVSRDPTNLLVSFTVRPVPSRLPGPFAKPFADKRNYSGLYVVSKWAHWWQTSELYDVEELINKSGKIADAHNCLAYGASMGAYGVLLTAARLGIPRALVAAPQVTFRNDLVICENPYAADTDKLLFREDDARDGMTEKCEYNILYDPFEEFDQVQVNLISDSLNVHKIPLPFASHSPLELLKQAGILGHVVESALHGNLSKIVLKRRIRSRRRHCPLYMIKMAQRAEKSNRYPLALKLSREALLHSPNSEPAFRSYARLLRKENLYSLLVSASEEYLAINKDDLLALENLRYAYSGLKDYVSAEKFAEILINREKPSAQDYSLYIKILIRNANVEKAMELATIGSGKFPINGGLQVLKLQCLYLLGNYDEALLLANSLALRADISSIDAKTVDDLNRRYAHTNL